MYRLIYLTGLALWLPLILLIGLAVALLVALDRLGARSLSRSH